MGTLELILLAAGAIIFLVSFCIPVKEEKLKEETRNLAAEEVKSLVSEEMERIRGHLTELSEAEVKEQIARSERTMERISNEKIMAVNEYSDTVLEEIHKNHEEVVFLYDMLKNKKAGLTESYSKADQNLQELVQQVKDSEITVKEKLQEISEKLKEYERMEAMVSSDMGAESKKSEFPPIRKEEPAKPRLQQGEEGLPAAAEALPDAAFKAFTPKKVEAAPKKRGAKKAAEKPKPAAAPAGDRDVMLFLSDAMGDDRERNNSNMKILEMHEAGKSNMAIARELGLGIGEVQLVIDLYDGFK